MLPLELCYDPVDLRELLRGLWCGAGITKHVRALRVRGRR